MYLILGGKRQDSDWIPVHADQEYVFEIQLSRINRTRVREHLKFIFPSHFNLFFETTHLHLTK